MDRRSKLLVGIVLFAASFVTLLWSGGDAPAVQRPTAPPALKPLYRVLAQAAQGRRVLVLHRRPERSGEILASAMTANGWALFPGAPPDSPDYAAALDRLAQAAAEDYFADGSFGDDTVRALRYFYVRFATVVDGTTPERIEVGERNPRLAWQADLQSVELRSSQPTYQLVSEPVLATPDDALQWGRKLVTNEFYPARIDLSGPPWEVSMRLEVERAGDYLLTWPSTGARIEVGGAPARSKPAAIPSVVLDLPVGSHDVVVRYRDADAGGWIAIVAAVTAVLGLGLVILALRPDVPPLEAVGEQPREEGGAPRGTPDDPAADPAA